MKISSDKLSGYGKLTFDGRLDASSSKEAELALDNAMADGSSKLLIDMSRMDYVSSAGLRILLVAAKKMRQRKGAIAVFGLSDSVKEVFEISGFSAIIPIRGTEPEAASTLGA